MKVELKLEMPGDLAFFRLPKGVARRLQSLLDKQEGGDRLTCTEKREAKGLVELAEMLLLLRLRSRGS
jgi:hypothetical protein